MARQGLIHSAQRSSVDPSPHARRLRRIMLLIHQAVGRCDAGAAVDPGPCSRLVRAATRSPAAPADLLPPEVSSIGAIPTGIVLVCVSGWRHSGQYLIPMSRSWAFRPCLRALHPHPVRCSRRRPRRGLGVPSPGSASDRSPLQPAGCQSGPSPRCRGLLRRPLPGARVTCPRATQMTIRPPRSSLRADPRDSVPMTLRRTPQMLCPSCTGDGWREPPASPPAAGKGSRRDAPAEEEPARRSAAGEGW